MSASSINADFATPMVFDRLTCQLGAVDQTVSALISSYDASLARMQSLLRDRMAERTRSLGNDLGNDRDAALGLAM